MATAQWNPSRFPQRPGWRKTYTAREPGFGSRTKIKHGYQQRFYLPLKVQTTPSGWCSLMSVARLFGIIWIVVTTTHCCLFIQEITISTTGKDIKDGKEGLPPLRNPPLLETADDLATLSHLNEPSGSYAVTFAHSIAINYVQSFIRFVIVMLNIASTPIAESYSSPSILFSALLSMDLSLFKPTADGEGVSSSRICLRLQKTRILLWERKAWVKPLSFQERGNSTLLSFSTLLYLINPESCSGAGKTESVRISFSCLTGVAAITAAGKIYHALSCLGKPTGH